MRWYVAITRASSQKKVDREIPKRERAHVAVFFFYLCRSDRCSRFNAVFFHDSPPTTSLFLSSEVKGRERGDKVATARAKLFVHGQGNEIEACEHRTTTFQSNCIDGSWIRFATDLFNWNERNPEFVSMHFLSFFLSPASLSFLDVRRLPRHMTYIACFLPAK